jgi:hypothetical protein
VTPRERLVTLALAAYALLVWAAVIAALVEGL